MYRLFLVIVLILATLAVFGCEKSVDTALITQSPPVEILAKEGSLVIRQPDGTQQLIPFQGRGFSHHVSPDNQWICVDQSLFSNLQVTQLYSRNDKNEYAQQSNLSTVAWKKFTEANDVEMDEIDNARTRFLRWEQDPARIVLVLTGSTADDELIDQTIVLPLQD